MEADTEGRDDQLKSLRRRIAEDWPESPHKEIALRALDAMIYEAFEERRSDS